MGSILSTISGAFKALRGLFLIIRNANAQYQAVQARIHAAPGLPVPSATAPYWLDDPPFPELVEVRSPSLLAEADVVVVGSGITAAAVARALLRPAATPPPRVVVLEARQLCSGATGRNGGHVKASPHETAPRWRRRVSAGRAAALGRFQLRQLAVVERVCEEEDIEIAEFRRVETVDLLLDEEAREAALKNVEEFTKAVPEAEFTVWDAAAARKNFDVGELVKGAVSYPAGAFWPYRFVVSVWKSLLSSHPSFLSIETGTPVTDISSHASATHPFRLATPRGDVLARHVVHATNAFAGQLVPGLRGKTTGIRLHVSAQPPGVGLPGLGGRRSWSVFYGKGFDYATQRPGSSGRAGDVLLGGGFSRARDEGLEHIGVYDDGCVDGLTAAHLYGVFPAVFGTGWGADEAAAAPRRVWSGIDGLSGDMLPLVGRLDERLTGRTVPRPAPGSGPSSGTAGTKGGGGAAPGEWISASYCGDGMVWAWSCGTAVGNMILGEEAGELPPELLATYERVKRLDLLDFIDDLI